jgi:transcriptional regulator with XRE-family HTH domain
MMPGLHFPTRRELSESMRAVRRSAGLTQRALADRLDLDVSAVNRMERAVLYPRFDGVARWYAACGCPLVLPDGGNL